MVGKPITTIDQKFMKVRACDFDNSEHKKSKGKCVKKMGITTIKFS